LFVLYRLHFFIGTPAEIVESATSAAVFVVRSIIIAEPVECIVGQRPTKFFILRIIVKRHSRCTKN